MTVESLKAFPVPRNRTGATVELLKVNVYRQITFLRPEERGDKERNSGEENCLLPGHLPIVLVVVTKVVVNSRSHAVLYRPLHFPGRCWWGVHLSPAESVTFSCKPCTLNSFMIEKQEHVSLAGKQLYAR